MNDNLPLHSRLEQGLGQLLPGVRITQVRTLAAMVVALQQSKGIHLGQIANQMPGTVAQTPSVVNRLQRFVSNERIQPATFYRPFAQALLAQCRGAEIRLVADVTKVGLNSRMLTISLACHARTLPLAWSVHPGAKGAVAVEEQIALLEELQPLLPAGSPVSLLADAGFEATELVRWLLEHGWRFTLRRPGCHKVCSDTSNLPSGADPTLPAWVRLDRLSIRPGQTRSLGQVRLTEKAAVGPLSLTLHWAQGEDEPWYLVSTAPTAHAAVRHYRLRMWVEEMYGDFKDHGFDLEATHLRSANRIERLVLALAINYIWFVALASWVVKNSRRRLIDHKSRRDKSYFRLGLDWICYCARCSIPVSLRFVPYFRK